MPHSELLSWSAADRSKAVAYYLEKSARCSLCGTAQWEWDQNPDAYQAVTEFCPGCYRKDAVMDGSEGSLPGTSVALIPTNSPEWKAVLARQEAEYEAERRARLAEQEG